MSPEIVGLIGVAIMVFLIFARMGVGFAMLSTAFLGITYLVGIEKVFFVLGTVPYSTIASYPMAALPLFVLMGAIVSNTGMAAEAYNSAYKWFGQLRGGLAIATTGGCALFAAVCGSSMAEVLTAGKIALPEMKRYKYDEGLATGCVAAAGTLAILIPPSLAFILYGILTEQSAGKLFMAGIFPGMLLLSLFIIVIIIWGVFRPAAMPPATKTSFTEKIISLKSVWPMLVLFLLVMGGIYGGIFTPTEAGAIGAFGAIVVTLIGRHLTLKSFLSAVLDAGTTAAMIIMLLIGAFTFARFMTLSGVPVFLSETIGGLGWSPYVTLAIIVLLYIILGMFLDVISAIVITLPLIYPVVMALGFDPIWFGVIMVILNEMGLVTPPVGMNIFLLASVTDIPMGTMFRGIWPFVLMMLICVILLTIFPQIALFIPNSM